MRKKATAPIEDSAWEVTWEPALNVSDRPVLKQKTLKETDTTPHTGRKRIAYRDGSHRWVHKWGKKSTDKKKRRIFQWDRPGTQDTWEDMVEE